MEKHGLSGPVEKWRDLRDQVRDEILAKGFDAERNTFTQHYETDEVDASLLLIPICGFLPPDDPKVLGTIDAIVQDLMHEGLLLRYRTDSGVDGLPGPSIRSSRARSGWCRRWPGRPARRARELMDRLVALVNDVGLLSEEYDPKDHRMVGNYPQAFSHLTLIGAAHALAGVATVKA